MCVCRVMIFGFLTWASSEIPIFSVEMFAMPLFGGAAFFRGIPSFKALAVDENTSWETKQL